MLLRLLVGQWAKLDDDAGSQSRPDAGVAEKHRGSRRLRHLPLNNDLETLR